MDSAAMVGPYRDPLSEVLQSLEDSLQVKLIASENLFTCQVDDSITDVFNRSDWAIYSQFPVRDGNGIVGVLERGQVVDSNLVAGEAMRPLHETLLVEASTGILNYIHLAATSPYHLVVTGKKISGIVTRSDLLKLPVRVVLFTLLTHLEATMANAIRALFPDDSWVCHLSSEGRKEKLEAEFAKGEQQNLYADRLTFTQWCDKREILAKGVPSDRLGSKTKFRKDLETLEKLRDSVMHANNYLTDARELERLVDKAIRWTERLTQPGARGPT